ncbi:hypothetical protein KXD40_003992 [Peronospora effusa]|nr:hypothetical protein KXD40_003992 [Peronospora effusa]
MQRFEKLRYLKMTQDRGICYKGKLDKLQLSAYTDAYWASNKDNCRVAPVIVKPMMQQSAALSTAEAEFMVPSLCVQGVLWISE